MDLWCVTEAPEVLYWLHTDRIERWGSLRSLLEIGGIDGLLSGNTRTRVTQHGLHWGGRRSQHGWVRELVDREELSDSGGVSDKFNVEISDPVNRAAGKAEAVLGGLSNEDGYFREEEVEKHRAGRHEEGDIVPRPMRPYEQIHSEVVDVYCLSGLSPEAAADAASRLLGRISAASNPSVAGE